jgi:hypothetical protein
LIGRIDKEALCHVTKCSITLHSWQSSTDDKRGILLAGLMAKQQDGARNHAVKAMHELVERSDNTRCTTAKLSRKDHNKCEGLQMM